MLANDFQKPPVVLGIVNRSSQQRLRKTLNSGQGSLEFVRDIPDKILADAFEPAQFGHIVQNDHRSGWLVRWYVSIRVQGLHGRGRYRKTQKLHDSYLNIVLQTFLALQIFANKTDQFRASNDFI